MGGMIGQKCEEAPRGLVAFDPVAPMGGNRSGFTPVETANLSGSATAPLSRPPLVDQPGSILGIRRRMRKGSPHNGCQLGVRGAIPGANFLLGVAFPMFV